MVEVMFVGQFGSIILMLGLVFTIRFRHLGARQEQCTSGDACPADNTEPAHGRRAGVNVNTRLCCMSAFKAANDGSHSSSSFFATLCFNLFWITASIIDQLGPSGWSTTSSPSTQRAATTSH